MVKDQITEEQKTVKGFHLKDQQTTAQLNKLHDLRKERLGTNISRNDTLRHIIAAAYKEELERE